MPRKIFSFLYHAKKDLGQKTSCVYNISSTCDQVHSGQTGQTFEVGVEEQNWHICIGKLDKAAVAGPSLYRRLSIQTLEHKNHLHQILLYDHIIGIQLNSIPTMQTGRLAFSSAGHGNCSLSCRRR
jgi:hypothetical protein